MKTLNFIGKGSEYFKIWIVNILLTIITLGIYYPWAKVRTKKYFYSNTNIDNTHFEYLASGKQLILAYLIALVLYLTYSFSSNISPYAGIILVAVVLLASPWLIYRSMKFNMNVTSFANIRFSFIANKKNAYMVYLIIPLILFAIYGATMYPIVSIIDNRKIAVMLFFLFNFSFLYIFSYMKYKINDYIINGIKYSKMYFNTKLKTMKFFIILVKTVIFTSIIFIFIIILLGLFMSSYFDFTTLEILKNSFKDIKNNKEALSAFITAGAGFYISFIILGMLPMAYYTSKNREYIFQNTRLNKDISFVSTVKMFPLAYITFTNFLLIIFTLGIASPWVKVRTARYFIQNTHINNYEQIEILIDKNNSQSAVGEEIAEIFDTDSGFDIGI